MWWTPLLSPRATRLVQGPGGLLRSRLHALVHAALHHHEGDVLILDGSHAFNPYAYAEECLRCGHDPHRDAHRVLIRRALTPYQWHSTITQALPQRAAEGTAAVLALPLIGPFATDETQDWEAEAMLEACLEGLQDAARHAPVVAFEDLARVSRSHPLLALQAQDALGAPWRLEATRAGTRLAGPDGSVHQERLHGQARLDDYHGAPVQITARAR